MKRRDIIKGLASVPALGLFSWGYLKKKNDEEQVKKAIFDELNIKAKAPTTTGSMDGNTIRLGIIGPGGRGRHLMRAAGFAEPAWIESAKKRLNKNPKDTRLRTFLDQENLNVQFTAVCDVFDVHADLGMAAAASGVYKPKKYSRYQDLLADPDVDAVIVATPDHW
ncbi:MAG: gfo/Idh/MocA family oxidoreductase, partial [Ekhidna sp.]|nr:gfo/Idh/MocA family oxidoreductase [Ekhidna sp.]